MAKDPFIWQAHEYIFQEKTSDWYWAVGIIGASVAVISLIFGNIIFALLIALCTFCLMLFGAKEPALVRFEINKTGVLIDRRLYPYGTLQSFWVEDNRHRGHQSKLFLKSKRLAVPLIAVPLEGHEEGVNPEDIRDFLLDHLLEDEHAEPLGQKVLEFFGF